jgi:hypothetical protein
MPVGVLEPQPTARPISRVVDSDGRFMAHGIVLFENPLGGRVCTVPYDCAGTDPDTYKKGPSSFFYSESRKTQMRRIIAWLGRGLPPLTVEANGWTLPHRADGAGRVALAAMNINYDAWPRVEFVCAFDAAPRRVSWLKPDGKWKSLSKGAWAHSAGALRIRVEAEAPTHGVAAVLIETAS